MHDIFGWQLFGFIIALVVVAAIVIIRRRK